jgi:hypothetical protein
MTIIDEIIAQEWRFFDKVHNEGGRANCQNDFETFEIMRKSQFLSWDPATQNSYLADLLAARQVGRNLIQEKYARMMVSTAPAQYATFAHTLPPLSDWQRETIETIVKQQVSWRVAFGQAYPRMASQARLIHTHEDTAYGTSFETYLRGELGTYSEATLRAYENMINQYIATGENLTTAAMKHTAVLYGYQNLAAAERKLQASE